LGEQRRNLREAAVAETKRVPRFESGLHHWVGNPLCPQQRPRPIPPRVQQPCLTQRLALARHLRLALSKKRRQFADRQLLRSAKRQKPQPILVAKQAKQVSALSSRIRSHG
jgi:hypothetical protein